MTNEFVNELMLNFSNLVNAETLAKLEQVISAVITNYDVSRKVTDLIPYESAIPKCFEYFIVAKKIEGNSTETLKNYSNYLIDLFQTLRKPLEEITDNDIRAYLYRVQKIRNLSDRTLNQRRSVLSSFFGWASANEYVQRNPMLVIKPIKFEVKEREPLNAIELELVRNACVTKREKALIEVLYSTACRVSELCGLKISDVNFDDFSVKLFGKGRKHRTSYLSPKAVLYLKDYLSSRHDNTDALFVGVKRPYPPMSKRSVELCVKAIGERAGVGSLYPHLMRHTCATDLLAKGMDVVELKELLGHASLDTSMIYAKVSKNEVRHNHQKYIS